MEINLLFMVGVCNIEALKSSFPISYQHFFLRNKGVMDYELLIQCSSVGDIFNMFIQGKF